MDNNKFSIIVGILLTILIVVVAYLCSGCSAGGGSSRTCRSCGRSFTDSSNVSSIKKTNMCTNCYGNYQWGISITD